MLTKHPLESLYNNYFCGSETSTSTLSPFFKDILDIRDCAWDDFVDELKELKRINCTDFDRIKGLYSRLDRVKAKVIATERAKSKYAIPHELRIVRPF
jgi:hypothetical protein